MDTVDNIDGVIFKNLGEHEFRLNNHRDCINECIKAISNINFRLKVVTLASAVIGYCAQRQINKLKAEIEELKQAKGE